MQELAILFCAPPALPLPASNLLHPPAFLLPALHPALGIYPNAQPSFKQLEDNK